jgi:acetyl-CoA carboxylase biotin carboxyl carrier protein
VDLKEIKAIIDLMKKNSLTEFELEQNEFKIKLKRGGAGPAEGEEGYYTPRLAGPSAYPSPGPGASAGPVPVAPVVANEAEIKSPMIGTFYRTPSPDAAAYVDVGVEVGPETVVCIIEAMKVMNEIKAEARGIITSIVAENAKPVEFGQPLFKIRPL